MERTTWLIALLLLCACAAKARAPVQQVSAQAPPSEQAQPTAPSVQLAATPAPAAPVAEEVAPIRIHELRSEAPQRAFRVATPSRLWLTAPACAAVGFEPTLTQGATVLARIDGEQILDLTPGVYELALVSKASRDTKPPGRCAAFFQVRPVSDTSCAESAAIFGFLPFDSEVPLVEPLGDLNADAQADYKVMYGASPTQVATRVLLGQPAPECVRLVFEGIGHVSVVESTAAGTKQLYFIEARDLSATAPAWLDQTHGSTWSVTWLLDFERSSFSYRQGPTPIRCERTDGTQRAFGKPTHGEQATLIPSSLCQTRYFANVDE